MGTYYSWEHTLKDILRVVNPTDDDCNKRFEIIDNLKALVESLEILRGGFCGINSLYYARVPILKCDMKKSNISCNISINSLKGHMKSKILLWINTIDGRFRDMVLLVKEWAKTHCINDSKTGTLSSYSLGLLVIFHFQTLEPAILPPLNEIYQGNMADDLCGVRAVAEQNIEKICREKINRIKSDRSRTSNRSSLAEIFISFLEKFCDIDLRASEQGISPYNGQWEYIENNMIWQPKTYQLFIEDPFEQPLNCARGISGKNLRKIAEAFKSSLNKLTCANQNRAIDVLVRQEILSIMSRQSVLSLDNNGVNCPRIHTNHIWKNNGDEHRHRNGGSVAARGGFESGPMNLVDMRPRLVSNGQKNRVNQSNGFGGRSVQGSMGEVERVRTNPKNGSGRAQQIWKLKSGK